MNHESGIVSSATLVAKGGFAPPLPPPAWTESVRVRNPIRRWWWRRTGWSTEWTIEHEPYNYFALFRESFEALPAFTAARGGIDYGIIVPQIPRSKWQLRKLRWSRKTTRQRERLAYRIAPSLRDRDWDDYD